MLDTGYSMRCAGEKYETYKHRKQVTADISQHLRVIAMGWDLTSNKLKTTPLWTAVVTRVPKVLAQLRVILLGPAVVL